MVMNSPKILASARSYEIQTHVGSSAGSKTPTCSSGSNHLESKKRDKKVKKNPSQLLLERCSPPPAFSSAIRFLKLQLVVVPRKTSLPRGRRSWSAVPREEPDDVIHHHRWCVSGIPAACRQVDLASLYSWLRCRLERRRRRRRRWWRRAANLTFSFSSLLSYTL